MRSINNIKESSGNEQLQSNLLPAMSFPQQVGFSMLKKTLALFLLPALAAAQYGYLPPPPPDTTAAPSGTAIPSGTSIPSGTVESSGAASPTSPALPVAPSAPADTPGHMNIDVAFQETFAFHPSNVTAPVGTLVTFWFPNFGLNHSVTQSSFQNPCTHLEANASTGDPAGFDSSLLSAANFTINITDSKPIWFFCKQIMHCGAGMVGSINAPATGNTFDAFMSAAVAIGGTEPVPTDIGDGPVLSGVSGNATGPPIPDLPSSAQPSVPVLSNSAQPSAPVPSASAQPVPTPSASALASTDSNGAMKATTSIGFALFAAALGVAMA